MLSGDSWNLVAIWRTKQVWNIGGRSLPSYMHHYDILMLILLISDLDSGQPFIKSLSLQIFGNSWEYLVDFCQCISFWKKKYPASTFTPFFKSCKCLQFAQNQINIKTRIHTLVRGPLNSVWSETYFLFSYASKWQHGSVLKKSSAKISKVL